MCLGAEARVPGLTEEVDVLDVGIGLDPEIVGQGKGRSIVAPVLEWAEATHEAAELRGRRASVERALFEPPLWAGVSGNRTS